MTVIEKDNEIYHDEHDCTIKMSNDNTKHLRVVSVTLRCDLTGTTTLKDAVKFVDEAFKEAVGS
jgi:hypothetical protein